MNARRALAHRLLLAVSAVTILVPGLRLLLDTSGYVDGKDNLSLAPDLYSELRSMGSLFVAAGLVLIAGAFVQALRLTASLVGVVAFLPQGITRLVSFSIDEGQHDSYLRAGIVETVLGVLLASALALALVRRSAGANDEDRSNGGTVSLGSPRRGPARSG